MRNLKLLLFIAILLCPLFCFARNSDVYIGISSKYDPNALPKIAMGSFKYAEGDEKAQETSNLLSNVVRSDLMRSRYFNLEENIGFIDTNNIAPSLDLARSKKSKRVKTFGAFV